MNARATVSRASSAERRERVGIGEQPLDLAGERHVVVGRDEEQAGPGGRDVLRAALAAGADGRKPGRHRLDEGDAERLLDAGHDEQVAAGGLGERLLVRELAGEAHRSVEPELAPPCARAARGPGRRR